MIKRFFLMALIYFCSFGAYAENYTAIAQEAEKNKSEIIKSYLQIAEDTKRHSENLTTDNKKPSKVIIFVSFSMPEQSIVSLLNDAKKFHASIVIRGLIHNSFKETFIKMSSIVKLAGDGGVELNPLTFRKFHIQKVPAVILIPDEHTCFSEKICPKEKFDVVYGDIPLLDALKTIRDHGTVSKKAAEEILAQLGGSLHA